MISTRWNDDAVNLRIAAVLVGALGLACLFFPVMRYVMGGLLLAFDVVLVCIAWDVEKKGEHE